MSIDLNETEDTAREIPFFLADLTYPINGIVGHTFVPGQVMVALPGGTYAVADITRIREIGQGTYALKLTDAQVALEGKVYVYFDVPTAQAGTVWEEIVSSSGSSAGAGGGGGGGGSGSGFLVEDLIKEAKALVDDDHDTDQGWIDIERWYRWLNWEWQALYQRMVKCSLVRPPVLEETFTGHTVTLSGVLCVVGVFEDVGYPRRLKPASQDYAPEPFYPTYQSGKSVSWAAYGTGDNFTVELYPRDAGGTYTVRYIPQIAYVSSLSQRVLVPQGFERRIVYGMATHAMIKESSASRSLEKKIFEADAQIGFVLAGRIDGGGHVVRRNRQRLKFDVNDPRGWIYP